MNRNNAEKGRPRRSGFVLFEKYSHQSSCFWRSHQSHHHHHDHNEDVLANWEFWETLGGAAAQLLSCCCVSVCSRSCRRSITDLRCLIGSSTFVVVVAGEKSIDNSVDTLPVQLCFLPQRHRLNFPFLRLKDSVRMTTMQKAAILFLGSLTLAQGAASVRLQTQCGSNSVFLSFRFASLARSAVHLEQQGR